MEITKVTRQGLIAIAFAATLLWGCLMAERAILQRAASEQAATMRQLDELRNRARPNTKPAPATKNPFRAPRSALA
jgi:hypothetical protein